ncbi:MAG: universal stress protein [Chloroflexi bacterium]|nr:universal stress protein [Chloroflexota bacterium]MBP7041869.1 universal stress protein [Chloroflexota bacterium]
MYQCQRLLVPLDGSSLAERALPPAFAIAQALSTNDRCAVDILRVVPPLFLTIDPILYAETLHLSEEEAQSYLETIAIEWSKADLPITTAVTAGSVAESIIGYTQQNGINLIVMSSHGRSGLGRWVYGSVTEKVLRHGCCATLIIRQTAKPPPEVFHKILVCLDGSLLAEQVLDPIFTIARATQAEITLLRVLTPSHLAIETYAMEQLLANVEEMERDTAEAYLRQLLVKLAPEDLTINTQTAVGPAADVIIDTAANQGMDLIAMCSHGRSGISRWVYGSVTEKVLRGATCATFILRGNEPASYESDLRQ